MTFSPFSPILWHMEKNPDIRYFNVTYLDLIGQKTFDIISQRYFRCTSTSISFWADPILSYTNAFFLLSGWSDSVQTDVSWEHHQVSVYVCPQKWAVERDASTWIWWVRSQTVLHVFSYRYCTETGLILSILTGI